MLLFRIKLHRKAVFALAGVFLAVALVMPPVLFKLQADQDLDNYITAMENPGMETSGNVTIPDQINENHQTTFLIVLVIEVVFVILFAITLYYGINYRPDEDKNQANAAYQSKSY